MNDKILCKIFCIHETLNKEREMAEIRPVSNLQRKLGEITKLAKETKEPVYLTKNGSKHLVLMDAEAFEKLLAKGGEK